MCLPFLNAGVLNHMLCLQSYISFIMHCQYHYYVSHLLALAAVFLLEETHFYIRRDPHHISGQLSHIQLNQE